MKPRAARTQGFTLIEIMVALAILSTALLVLLDGHYGAMSLFSATRDEVLMDGFLERALGQAEVEVLAGKASGTGDFGARYPDFTYAFSAQTVGSAQTGTTTQESSLRQVTVTVSSPTEERTMDVLIYAAAPPSSRSGLGQGRGRLFGDTGRGASDRSANTSRPRETPRQQETPRQRGASR